MQVLENFKEFNKVIRSNFLAGYDLKGLTDEEAKQRKMENKLANKVTDLMKKMQEHHRF